MATVWQRMKTVSSAAALPSLSSVTNLFNRNSYKDLDKDCDHDASVSESFTEASSPDIELHLEDGEQTCSDTEPTEIEDECDAGVARRKHVLLLEKEELRTSSEQLGSSATDATSENRKNERKETNFDNHPPSQEVVVVVSSPRHNPDIPESNANVQPEDRSDTEESPGHRMRRRRHSYDRALSEMRDSYDRVFTDIKDYSQEGPVELPVEAIVRYSGDVNGNRPSEFALHHSDSVSEIPAKHSQESGSKVSLRRQISDVIQKDIPSAIHVIRHRSYSKLGGDDVAVHEEPVSIDNDTEEWRNSFTAPDKKKPGGRKRSKKVWKKTKKAVRVTWKWLRRSFVSYSSSFHYGVPLNVAMYGGSRRSGRRAYYDYR